ncbi:MAG TPA: PEGA domain-containing protein [Acidiferrobacterales bacterium]|nr:PEGA domain-containing protein [Acidiferrobacterales bacterium]
MRARILFGSMLAILVLVAACTAKPIGFDLEVNVQLDGKPVKDASITVDGVPEGSTDARGRFAKTLSRSPEKPIHLAVQKEEGKFRAKTWEKTFSIKSRKDTEPVEKQSLTAELQRFVTILVTQADQPLAGASVSVDGKDLGQSQANGTVEHVFGKWPKNGLLVGVKKDGYGETRFAYRGESGDRINAGLYTEAVVTIEVLEDQKGRTRPIKGAAVTVGGIAAGSTGDNGVLTYRHKGTFGETVPVRISAAGFAPSSSTRPALLGGQNRIKQYFHSAVAERPRTAVLSFAANTAGEDISDVVKKFEESFNKELFDSKTFKSVPAATARELMGRSKLSVDKIKTSDWRNTGLGNAVDVIVFGSISRGEDDDYVIETSFYQSNGKLALTQAAVAGSGGSWRVGRAVNEIVSNVLAAYPISGTVIAGNDEGAQINLGRGQFAIGGDDIFLLQSTRRDENGRITGYSDAGTMKVRRRRDDQTDLQMESLRAPPRAGDRVTRLDVSVRAAGTDRITVAVKGGVGKEGAALTGTNVYLDNRWAGTTNRAGEASVPLKLGRNYRLMVYRHGYGQATRKIKPGKPGERYEFGLKSFSSQFTAESEPSGASVSIDDNRVGSTPITKPQAVTFGFHTVRVEAGGDYRAWEEVVEFSKKEEKRTGANRIVLHKDYLKLGEQAEAAGRLEDAIRLYSSGTREHPDYADLHHRLGQLYYDGKRDYDRAIAEFESVQAIPAVEELVYKQYAIVYTNLGKAYYAKGAQVYRANRGEAVQYYAKAVKALDRARENTRFFPNERHDEAVHDTYYYRALAYQNLYDATQREALSTSVELAWLEYLDTFPSKLRGNPEYDQMRESAEKLAKQVQGK